MISNNSSQFLPALPLVSKESADTPQIMHLLRHFHLGNPTVTEQLESLSDDYLPALLSAYRDASQLRYDYPLYLCPYDPAEEFNPSLAVPVSDFLHQSVEAFAPSEGSSIALKDNLPWIERSLRETIRKTEGPTLIKPMLVKACETLTQHLNFNEDNQLKLQKDIAQLIESIPDDGLILGYGRFPALHLLMHLISKQSLPQLIKFKQETQDYIQSLQILLDVDDTKQDEAKSASSLKSNISSNQFFNTESLSKVVKHSQGSVSMSAARRKRIEDALEVLKKFKEKETLVHIVHASNVVDNSSWLDESICFTSEHHDDPCFRATEIFDQEAQELAMVFAAARIARLELENHYDENIHDPWFNNFNWEAFSKKELILVPSVIVLEAANRLVDESMVSFSHLLNSGRPVNIFVRVQAHNNPGAKADEDPFHNYRTELGYLGISHRQAVVTQCSAARHELLLSHFNTALNATRTSLHLINVGLREVGEDSGLNAWLVAGAALEGRAHPFFVVDPGAGDSAAERFDFSGNPQPERDWPQQQFTYKDESGEVTELDLDFTFADYALLIPRLHHHFAIVPAECDSEELLPIAEYLAQPYEDVDNFVPYIWAVNKDNDLRMLAVSRALIHACRDRLNFWHSLQEMSGVRSRYIEEAEVRFKSDAEMEVAKQVAQAKAEFDEELERIKTETAAEVMSRLTDMLLGMDLSAGRAVVRTQSVVSDVKPEEVEQSSDKEPDEVIVEEPEESFDDPWIDSPLCTTCNDCTDMNPLMFVYNDTNQAIIEDLKAGTYLQMIEAAEICPSKCIHPGKPWDESESGLDELIERAKPFN